MLEDANLWWKGANLRSAALREAGITTEDCSCDRCLGADTCRAIKCPACNNGEVTRRGREKMWMCGSCDFQGSDKVCAGVIDIEQNLCKDFQAVSDLSMDGLLLGLDTVENRLGLRHWLAASLWFELVRRETASVEMNFKSALHTMQLLEWITTRNIGVPPPPVLVTDLATMAIRALDFMHARIAGVRDLRVVFVRSVEIVRNLFQVMDRSLLEHLKVYGGRAINIRRNCAFCESKLNFSNTADTEEEEQVPDDGGEVEDFLRVCGICKELSYCDLGCQKSDNMRHRAYCVPAGMPFTSKLVAQIFIPT
jgi:hypothetical protein